MRDATPSIRNGNNSLQTRRLDGCDGGFNCFTGCILDASYRKLIRQAALAANATFASKDTPKPSSNPGMKHDNANLIARKGPHKGQAYHTPITRLIQEYITPLVYSSWFDPWCYPVRYDYGLAHSIYSPEEDARGRVGVWHWDSGARGGVKVTVYLTDTDHEHACFVILRHNETGEPFITDGSRLWGFQAAPVVVPREWLSELFERGFRPHCISGPAGTIYMFPPNAIHRASRPKPGNTRDVLHIHYFQAGQGKRENGRCQRERMKRAGRLKQTANGSTRSDALFS